MECPKCKKELMNINGRYICVECGTEFSENDLNSAQANAVTELSGVDSNPVPSIEPALPSVSDAVQTTNEEIQTGVSPVLAVPDLSEPTANETPSETTPGITEEPAPVNELPSEPTVDSIPVVPEQIDVPETIPETTEPMTVEPTVADMINPGDNVASANSQDSFSMSTEPQSEPVLEEVPAEEIQQPSEPVAEAGLTVQETQEIPINVATGDDSVVSTELPLAPEAPEVTVTPPELSTDFSGDAPVDPFEASAPVNADPNIYQNPMFDEQVVQSQPANNVNQVDVVQPQAGTGIPEQSDSNNASNTTLLAILIGGLIMFLTLGVGGVMAYRSLTQPAEVEPTTLTKDNITEEVSNDVTGEEELDEGGIIQE